MKIITNKLKLEVFLYLLFNIVQTTLIILVIFISGLIIKAFSQKNWNQFLIYFFIDASVAIFKLFLSWIIKTFKNNLENKLLVFYQEYLVLNSFKFKDEKLNLKKGMFTSVIFETIPKIIQNRIFELVNLVTVIFSFFLGLGVLIYYNWLLSLISVFLAVFSVYLSILISNKLAKQNYTWEKTTNKSNNLLNLLFASFSKFFFYKKTKQFSNQLEKENLSYVKKISKLNLKLEKLYSLNIALILSLQFLMEIVAISFFILGWVPIETFATVPFLFGLLSNDFSSAGESLSAFQGSKKIENKIIPQKKVLQEQKSFLVKSIVFKDFNIKFNNKKLYLKNLNFHFQKGINYLIVGPSGIGKSSLFFPLFYDNFSFEGKVLINQREIDSFDKREIYSSINYLEANSFLFAGLVRNNITLFDSFSDKKIYQSLKKACLDKEILNKKTENLSQGEKQRVALVGVLIRNPKWLIIDEGLSNVDAKTFNSIAQNLVAQKINVIHISHNKNIKKENYDQKITL